VGATPLALLVTRQIGGSRVAPATNGFSESSRKPTISWAFVLFRRTSRGLSTGLSGLFIGTDSPLAYAAYARVRGPRGLHAAPFRRGSEPGWRCIGQPYACPMQLPYSMSLGDRPLESGRLGSRGSGFEARNVVPICHYTHRYWLVTASQGSRHRPQPFEHGATTWRG
jgi:hypothetical protein